MSTDLVVVHAPVGGGHKAAATALVEAARARGLSVDLLDIFACAPKFVGKSYVTAHLTGQNALPDLYGSAYFAANRRDPFFDSIRHAIDRATFGKLAQQVNALRPRAVMATHHLPLVVLGDARVRGLLQAPLYGVVTDYTAHACWAEEGVDGFFVAGDRAREDMEAHGIERARIARTGIPVKRAFDAIADVRDPSKNEPLRVLVTNGGFGVGPMRDVVASFAGVPRVELVVVCGRAPRVEEEIRREANALGLSAEVVGFETNMAARIERAHVVVGKAGGLTVSETMTAGRPMIIVGAVPGNEKINEMLVTESGAGFGAMPVDVGRAAAWIRDRAAVARMGRRARGFVAHRAADAILDRCFGASSARAA